MLHDHSHCFDTSLIQSKYDYFTTSRATCRHRPANNIQIGNVRNQAITIVFTTPQFTPNLPVLLPAPMIDPETACVVDSGIPKREPANSTTAELNSAAKPLTGFNLATLVLKVL